MPRRASPHVHLGSIELTSLVPYPSRSLMSLILMTCFEDSPFKSPHNMQGRRYMYQLCFSISCEITTCLGPYLEDMCIVGLMSGWRKGAQVKKRVEFQLC